MLPCFVRVHTARGERRPRHRRLPAKHCVCSSVGVERIEAEGKPFDPNLHEAIGSEESEETDEDTVTAELRPGYRMHDRVLRPALVRVSRRPG